MKKQSTTIASIVILIIIAIFALLNTATVVVNLFGAQVKMPLVLLIFICLLIGAIIIYLLSFSNHLKTNKQLKELQSSRVSKDEFKKYQKKIFAVISNMAIAVKRRDFLKEFDQLQKENAQLKQQLKNQTVAEKAQDSSAK